MLRLQLTPFPILETERLTLRRITMSDLDAMHAMRSDDGVRKYLDTALQTRDEVAAIITKGEANIANNEAITWAITLKGDDTFIGSIGYWRSDLAHHRAEIGYMLVPAHWQKGILTEAMQAVLDYGFKNMKLHSIEANVNPDNIASVKLLKRYGFEQEAYFKENFYYDGKFLDSAIYCKVTPYKD